MGNLANRAGSASDHNVEFNSGLGSFVCRWLVNEMAVSRSSQHCAPALYTPHTMLGLGTHHGLALDTCSGW